MGRKLMRVPLDFDAPLNEVWRGYTLENASTEDHDKFPVTDCGTCEVMYGDRDDYCREEDTPYCVWYNSKWRKLWHEEPPGGEGYQLWTTTTEGSPISPVFETLDELCEWAADNATTFASFKAIKEEWKEMLIEDNVHHTEGNITFI